MRKAKIFLLIPALISVYIAFNVISICEYSKKNETCNADVAIVLGASTYNGRVSPVYRERIHHAIHLYNDGYVKK